MDLRRCLAVPAAAIALLLPHSAAIGGVEHFVLKQPGSLPIILTAPHGGAQAIPGVSARVVEEKGYRYNAGRDPETDRLAIGIAAEIKALTGKDVYLVVARFDRKFIDANRPPEVAFDNPAARTYYEHYHRSIRTYLDEIRAKFPAALLIDVHGQHKMRDSLVRGTLNGKSVAKLIARSGHDAITGPRGLFGQLESNGFRVFPANSLRAEATHEDAGFNGGFTTMTYGSHRKDGIDAIQFEFGSGYRSRKEVDASIRKAARAIVAFQQEYLK